MASPHVLLNSIIIPSILYYSKDNAVVYNQGKDVANPGLILYDILVNPTEPLILVKNSLCLIRTTSEVECINGTY